LWTEVPDRCFKFKQCPFAFYPASVSDQLSIGSDYPMARNNDCHRIPTIGQPDRSRDTSGTPGLLFVGDRLTERDRAQRLPGPDFEFRPFQTERDTELRSFSSKEFFELPNGFGEGTCGLIQNGAWWHGQRVTFDKVEAG
jgi:hypothetical protein